MGGEGAKGALRGARDLRVVVELESKVDDWRGRPMIEMSGGRKKNKIKEPNEAWKNIRTTSPTDSDCRLRVLLLVSGPSTEGISPPPDEIASMPMVVKLETKMEVSIGLWRMLIEPTTLPRFGSSMLTTAVLEI